MSWLRQTGLSDRLVELEAQMGSWEAQDSLSMNAHAVKEFPCR
jgi:hypothetical protein